MRRVIALSLALLTIAPIDESGTAKKKASPELQAWRENTVGREFWLRTDVIRVQGTL